MSPDCSIAPVERLVRVRYGLAAFENGHGYSIIILARVKIKAAIEQAGWEIFFLRISILLSAGHSKVVVGASCASSPVTEDWRTLRIGMTRDGPPNHIEFVRLCTEYSK